MLKYFLTIGPVAGLAAIFAIIAGHALGEGTFFASVTFGYLTMLVALSTIFVAMKRYRDREQGGVLKFLQGAGLGIGISVLAGFSYVAVWEGYLAATDYAFIEEYSEGLMESAREEGKSEAELAELQVQIDGVKANYGNPLFRLFISFIEIFPVGVLVSLVSAGILRRTNVLSAQ